MIYRPQYRGGWSLPDGTSIPIPAIAGGDQLDLQIELLLAPEGGTTGIIEVSDGEGRVLQSSTSHQFGEWMSMSFKDLPSTAGEALTLTFRGPADPPPSADYIATLDRATLTWR